MKKSLLILGASLLLFSCNKEPGPGGTSSITGTVFSQDHSDGKTEITEIIFTNGDAVEHGDYWVLNNPYGSVQYEQARYRGIYGLFGRRN